MRIVLTGGVTGGHIYPAIAIGDRFRASDPECEIIYIASGEPLEREIITKAGYELFEVHSEPFYRDNIFRMMRTLSRTIKGRSEAKRILKDFNADMVISTGSYVSVPVVLAAVSLGKRIYIHEQNAFPGMSNKFLAKYANKVFLGFESAGTYFSDESTLKYSGNPVREEFSGRDKAADREELGIPGDDFVIMIFGGSLGSDTTNSVGEAISRKYADAEGVTVIWGTGTDYYEDISGRLDKENFKPSNVRIMPYISDMPVMLSACDLSISRSGALSVAETTMAGRVAVFIPSPNVTEDHQYYNAKAVADAGGAFIVREDEGIDYVNKEIADITGKLMSDSELRSSMEDAGRSMAPVDAVDIIYNTIIGRSNEEICEEEIDFPTGTEEDADPEIVDEPETCAGSETGSESEIDNETEADNAADTKQPAENEKDTEDEEISEEDLEIAERIRLRKLETAAKSRRLRRRAVTAGVMTIAAITALVLSFTSIFTVDLIEVRGNDNYSDEEIISMAHAGPGKNIIYHPDKESITENLKLNPYIKSVEVSRKLPSTLVITVSERQQMMALKYDDDYLILDRDGILLQKSRTRPKLTLVQGNIITKIKLGEQLGTKDDELINKSINLMQSMTDNDLYYVKVDMSDLSSVKAYVYDTLLVRTDYDTLIKNMENGRLHMVLDKLIDDSIKRGTITFVDDETASFMPIF